MIANTTMPNYFSGMMNGADWVNQINSILAYSSICQDIKKVTINAGFTPVIGTLYLIATGSISPYTPGTIAIWFDPTKPPQGFDPSAGTVVGEWTKNSAGNNWVNNSISDMRAGSIFITAPSAAQTITLPNLLDGLMTICHYGSAILTVNPSAGRSSNGKIGLPLNTGIYQVYQNSSISLI